MQSTKVKVMYAVLAAALAACGPELEGQPAPAPEAPKAQQSEALIGGVATNARPEIGSYSGGCTATLIAPQWAITAGHCTGYTTAVPSGAYFQVTYGLDGAAHTYSIDRIHIFGAYAAAGAFNSIAFENTPDETGTNDVAILHLSSAVPASVAVPAVLASGPPANGTTVTVFGYGCQDRGTGGGGGYKQAVTYTWPSSNVLCPGDSGGPVVIGLATGSGAVVGVNTGYWSNFFSTWDVHGEATYFRDDVMSVIRGASGTGSFEYGFDRPGSDFTSFAASSVYACSDSCRDNASCRAFTYAGGWCWLKAAVPDWVPCPTCTSAIAPQKEVNVNRYGGDIGGWYVGTQGADACITMCGGTPSCSAYTYVPPSGSTAAVCWLKSSVPGTSIAYGLTSGVRRGLENNINRAGYDYSDFDVSNTPSDCSQRCSNETNCRAFTFTWAGTNGRTNAHCWLKSAVGGPSSLSFAVSGVKRGLEMDTNRWGGDYSDFDLGFAVPEDCQARCAQDGRCQAFTYLPPGWNGSSQPNAHCYLKNTIPGTSSATGLVSGVRGADFF